MAEPVTKNEAEVEGTDAMDRVEAGGLGQENEGKSFEAGGRVFQVGQIIEYTTKAGKKGTYEILGPSKDRIPGLILKDTTKNHQFAISGQNLGEVVEVAANTDVDKDDGPEKENSKKIEIGGREFEIGQIVVYVLPDGKSGDYRVQGSMKDAQGNTILILQGVEINISIMVFEGDIGRIKMPGETEPEVEEVEPDQEEKGEDELLDSGEVEENPEEETRSKEDILSDPEIVRARSNMVAAWMQLRKYRHGFTGMGKGLVQKKAKEEAWAQYDDAKAEYDTYLQRAGGEVEQHYGKFEKMTGLVDAMEKTADERADAVIKEKDNEKLRVIWKSWEKLGKVNLGEVKWVKETLATSEGDGKFKDTLKGLGRFATKAVGARMAIGLGLLGAGAIPAYLGWRMAASAAGAGVGTYTVGREGMTLFGKEIVKGSERAVNTDYSQEDLSKMNDEDLGNLMHSYGSRLSFDAKKLEGNEVYKRVKDTFVSRFRSMMGSMEEFDESNDNGEDFDPKDHIGGEARFIETLNRRNMMDAKLESMAMDAEDELDKQEKTDQRRRITAAVVALAAAGAVGAWQYSRMDNGGGGAAGEGEPEAEEGGGVVPPPVEQEGPPVLPVDPEVQGPGAVDSYTIKGGEGLLHAANDFQGDHKEAILAGIKQGHQDWVDKGLSDREMIHKWRYEMVKRFGSTFTDKGEAYSQLLHKGAEIELRFDANGYPILDPSVASWDAGTVVEHSGFREHVGAAAATEEAMKPDFGFEKWDGDRPVHFKAPGVQGEALYHPDPDGGTGHVEIRHSMVDSKQVARFINPGFKEALGLIEDAATRAVMQEQGEQMVEDYVAHSAMLEDLQNRGMGDSPAAQALKLQRASITEEANKRFPDSALFNNGEQLFVGPTEIPEPAAESVDVDAMTSMVDRYPDGNGVEVAKLVFPDDWSSAQTEAAKRLIEAKQGIAENLTKAFESYARENPDVYDTVKSALEAKLSTATSDLIQSDDYSVLDMLKRIDANKSGGIPTYDLVPGASTVAESAKMEADEIFRQWTEDAAPS